MEQQPQPQQPIPVSQRLMNILQAVSAAPGVQEFKELAGRLHGEREELLRERDKLANGFNEACRYIQELESHIEGLLREKEEAQTENTPPEPPDDIVKANAPAETPRLRIVDEGENTQE